MNDVIMDVPEFLKYLHSPATQYHCPTKIERKVSILSRHKTSPLSQDITEDVDEYLDIFNIEFSSFSINNAEYFLPLDDFPYDKAENSFNILLQQSDKFIKYE